MTSSRRQTLRQIMQLAWSLYRAELHGPTPRTFANALAGAWKWTKGAAARVAAAPRWTAGNTRVAFGSMLQSPIRRELTGSTYAGRKAWEAGRVTSRIGC